MSLDVTREHSAEGLTLVVSGRLDGYWADHLGKELAEVLRDGVHHVRLDLNGVNYLSSAGIGALVRLYKQFEAIHGSFVVTNCSVEVTKLLAMTKLDTILMARGIAAPASGTHTAFRETAYGGVSFQVFDLATAANLRCEVFGDASRLGRFRFDQQDCLTVQFPASTFGLGLGAFGNNFAECRGRFGEFVTVAGSAAYLPTDATNVPDYMIAAETFIPELHVLYCARLDGGFSHLARFEANKESGAATLTELIKAGFGITESDAIGVVIVAETTGLVGVSLRRSPGSGVKPEDETLFSFPAIREWLSYSAERTHARDLALIAGIAVRNDVNGRIGNIGSMLRPLGADSMPIGHFHAAAFPYRPLKKGLLDLKTTTTALFEGGGVRTVTHLLNDTRDINGAGESEFVRGACWFGRISQ